jgi:hypothetical protein
MSAGRFIVVELAVWPRLVMCIVCLAITRIELKIPPPNWTAAVILIVVSLLRAGHSRLRLCSRRDQASPGD